MNTENGKVQIFVYTCAVVSVLLVAISFVNKNVRDGKYSTRFDPTNGIVFGTHPNHFYVSHAFYHNN